MTREEKIEAIYKEMANKELAFWCKVVYNEGDGDQAWIIVEQSTDSDRIKIATKHFIDDVWEDDITEIIWHPVMIGDVIKRIKENREISYWEYLIKLLGQLSKPWLWEKLDLSIDKQSDECVDYIYSLIKK